MNKTALFGAAGAVGKSIAAVLRARGEAYRVVGRNRRELTDAFGTDPPAEIVTWDPDRPESVQQAAEGVDTLVYLVGVPYNHFELHPVLMQKTLEGAIAAGVKRLVLVGTVYPYGIPQTPTVAESHPRNPPTFKGKMRKEQEEILLKAHREGRIQATILRLPDFYGPGVEKSFLHSVFQAAARGGTANMIGPIDTPHEFMFVPDIGPVVLAFAAKPEAYGGWWNFAGPGAITQRDFAKKVFASAGRKPKIFAVGKRMLRLIGLFNPLMREMVEMHYLQTTPVLMDDQALQQLLCDLPKTSYDEGIRQTLEAYRKPTSSISQSPR